MAASITFYGPDARAVAPVPTEEAPVRNARARRVMERDEPEEEMSRDGYAYRVPLHHKGKVAAAQEIRVDLASLKPHGFLPSSLMATGGLFLIFALLAGVFFRTSIGRPIEQLMDGMENVIRGDLTHALPLDRNDEIGRIAYRFNEMTAQLRDAQEEIHRSAKARIQLEQQLRQSEKLATVGQLAAEIAHEVGTPLNVIGGRARSLQRKSDRPDEVNKNAGIIADQAARITKIIEQMLSLSRRRVPSQTEVDLVKCIDSALTLLEERIAQAEVEVIKEIPRDLPQVVGDEDGLQQVFINLLLNAIQAIPEGGRLELTAEVALRRKGGLDLAAPQRFVSVSVADSGEGIPEELIGQIFEPFFSTKDKEQGTGLGLTVVHGIVKAHDGWIDVESPAPGGTGTVFRVHLPLEVEDAEAEHPLSAEADESAEPVEPTDPTEREALAAEPTERDAPATEPGTADTIAAEAAERGES
jgi:signal transduction histidine kinase